MSFQQTRVRSYFLLFFVRADDYLCCPFQIEVLLICTPTHRALFVFWDVCISKFEDFANVVVMTKCVQSPNYYYTNFLTYSILLILQVQPKAHTHHSAPDPRKKIKILRISVKVVYQSAWTQREMGERGGGLPWPS